MVGAAESAAVELDALDPQTLPAGAKLELKLLAVSARQMHRRLQSR